jgi:hypothetical protein
MAWSNAEMAAVGITVHDVVLETALSSSWREPSFAADLLGSSAAARLSAKEKVDRTDVFFIAERCCRRRC